MSRFSSAAPQIGAALGAGLMILSAVAFQAGARSEEGAAERLMEADTRLSTASFPLFVAAARPEPSAAPVTAPEPEPEPVQGPASARPRLAVIIDDVADMATAQRIWALGGPVTVSVLPYADQAPEIAAQAGDREVFLHLPMEPVGLEDPGPYALTKALQGANLSARLEWALSRVPGADGFNNHMGSRMTADADAMGRLFASLRGHQDELIFVDSLTHPGSVAREAALAAGFAALDRDVFLDHDPSPEAIEAQITAALDLALERGEAIAIGHPRPATLTALEELAIKAEAAGVELVPVRALVRG
jgi:polysaccharide deacetylase 2 family uncharacterized protein YibQ